MTKRDREKASDVFRNTEFLFSKKVSFAEAFPAIEDIVVVVTRGGHYGVHEWNKEERYGMNVGEYIDCTNPMCYKGGFSIGNLIRMMEATKQTHLEKAYIGCQGYEGSPKGMRRYRSCTNHFSVMIDVKYKSEGADEAP